MSQTKQTVIGYVAIIHKKAGGFLCKGTDYQSGCSYFEDRPVIRTSLDKAIEDAETLRKMGKYYDSSKHDFDKIVVCSVLLQEISPQDLEKNSAFLLKEKLKANFSEEEIKKIKKIL